MSIGDSEQIIDGDMDEIEIEEIDNLDLEESEEKESGESEEEKSTHPKMLVGETKFRGDLYPRFEVDASKVQEYALCLNKLPPIEINQNNELIDGRHRTLAHQKAKVLYIKYIVTQTASDAELLELAVERNSKHGLQLKLAEKQDMARKIYNSTPVKDREAKKKTLSVILSVGLSTVQRWLSRIDKDDKEARVKRIFGMWLACHTQQEIADVESLSRPAVAALVKIFVTNSHLRVSDKAASEHATDFEIPIYNIWKQQEKTPGSTHPGNTEIRWLDNLLYLYTKPFDIIIDPFAGSGSTIDLCRKRFRRYYISDRLPVEERATSIRKHDITTGLPLLPDVQWELVKLVYLDPPYWRQTRGKYSQDNTDLSNMDLFTFNKTLSSLITDFSKKLKGDAKIALIIQPTQWHSPNHEYLDHIADMIQMVKLPIHRRISVPYESQQWNAQTVEWAKQNREILTLTREIIIWKLS